LEYNDLLFYNYELGALLVVLLVRFYTDVVDSNTSSITASTMSVNVAVVNNMVAALLSDIDEAILAQPQVSPNSSSAPVIAWADHTFRTIHQALSDLVPMLAGRLNDLEDTPPSRQPTGTTTSGGATPEHLRPLRSQPGACPAARSATLAATRLTRVAPPIPPPCASEWRRIPGPRVQCKLPMRSSPLPPLCSVSPVPPSRPHQFPWSSQLSLLTPRSCAAVPHNRVETNAFAGALRPPRDPLGRGGVLNVGF
ncbi:hypothetical protein K438DRAFT_2095414, partial [Mycena galopus ATCC 62051]